MRKTPTWGKAIGIIMICLGSISVFLQLYKIIIARIMSVFPNMMDNVTALNPEMDTNQQQGMALAKQMMVMTREQANALIMVGTVGFLLLIFYIVAGAKLLTAQPANYNRAKIMLIIFILFNAFSSFLLVSGSGNVIVTTLGVYGIVGLVFDIVLFIILLTSNKADYGIGVDPELTSYTLHTDSEDIV